MPFLRSRYDILLNRPGREISGSEYVQVYGPRRSGRTRALLDNLQTKKGLRNALVTHLKQASFKMALSSDVTVECISYSQLFRGQLRGHSIDTLYIDDIDRDIHLIEESVHHLRLKNLWVSALAKHTDLFGIRTWEYKELKLC